MSRFVRVIIGVAVLALLGVLAACGTASPSLNGSEWRLVDWSNTANKASQFDITIAFDDGRLTGKAPVNTYGGDVKLGADGSFQPGEINSTLMAGSDAQNTAEGVYFDLLNKAEKYEVASDTLTLKDGAGKDLLVYERK